MHALDRVAVAHEVTPDDIRHCGIVVYDDDPAWRIGLLTKGFRSSKKGNDYASTVGRKQPVKPVNRAKAYHDSVKHSDDSVDPA